MKTSLTAGLTEQQKKEVTEDFKGAVALRAQLSKILDAKITSNRNTTISKDAYASPSWAYVQADAVGYERALREVISLLE